MKLVFRLKRNNLIKIISNKIMQLEFSKFVVVGIINTSINYGIFILLLLKLNFVYFIAGAIGFFSGAISGFFLNRFWTFKSDVPITIGLYKYFNVQLFCLVAHLTTQIGVTKLFGISEILSQLAGVIVTTFINFFISKTIVFNKRIQ